MNITVMTVPANVVDSSFVGVMRGGRRERGFGGRRRGEQWWDSPGAAIKRCVLFL